MNELANISVLEGIQTQANESMGHGQSACGMAVFNAAQDVKDVKDAADEFIKTITGIIQESQKYQAAKAKYAQTLKNVDSRRKAEAKTVQDMQKEGVTSPKKIYEKEYYDMLDIRSTVVDKQRELQSVKFAD